MGIYTRTGDSGETSLVGGGRVSKSSARVEAYGMVDEANCAVGFARSALDNAQLDAVLAFAQQRLFNCSSALATPQASETTPQVSAADITFLESATDLLSERCGGFRGFVLPAGSEQVTRLHLARAITRRAERRIVALAAAEPVDPNVLAFVNRLSDLLFAAASTEAMAPDCVGEPWDPSSPPPSL
jgi:cob(I)alamin adenosyltransferase